MEVIKVGTKNQVECGKCGSLLRFNEADVRLQHHPVSVGPYDIETMPEVEDHYRAVVRCPVCTTSVPATVSSALKRGLLSARDRLIDD